MTRQIPKLPPSDRHRPAEKRPFAHLTWPTALQLAGSGPIDIAVASERIRVGGGPVGPGADVLWLPTVYLGGDYLPARRADSGYLPASCPGVRPKFVDGPGAGPSAGVRHHGCAVRAVWRRRQVVTRSGRADLQTAANDKPARGWPRRTSPCNKARGELAGAGKTGVKHRRGAGSPRLNKLAPGLVAGRSRRSAARTGRRRAGDRRGDAGAGSIGARRAAESSSANAQHTGISARV